MKPKIFSQKKLLKKLPSEVKMLFAIFGDDIRLVGGCVRDLLLNKSVNDFDFATKFLPQKTTEILEKNKIKAVPTGIKFGTITAVINGRNFEITTLRQDNETDGRHCNPQFVDDYFFDAARRDFTVNALYLDAEGKVTDYFNGISDLKNKKIRFIGNAIQRIEEDYLRILRFFRFSCEYAKKIDTKGLEACFAKKKGLKKLSRERIRAEISKIILSSNKQNILTVLGILQSKKITEEILSSNLDLEALDRLFDLEKKLKFSADFSLKISALFDLKTLNSETFFTELCITNLEKKYFRFLENYFTSEEIFDKDLKKMIAENNDAEMVKNLYLLSLAKSSGALKMMQIRKNLKVINAFSVPEFPIKSSDLIAYGYSGKQLGEMLKFLKKHWIDSEFKLEKSALLSLFSSVNKV